MYKRFEKGSDEWNSFADFYQFRQNFYSVDREDPAGFWDACLRQAGILHLKYRSRFVTSLLLAHIDDLTRRDQLAQRQASAPFSRADSVKRAGS